jgi:hypothetical protein
MIFMRTRNKLQEDFMSFVSKDVDAMSKHRLELANGEGKRFHRNTGI